MTTAIFTGGEDPKGSSPGGVQLRDSGVVARRERRWGLTFVSPWLFGLTTLFAIPLVASLILSFTNYELADQDGEPTRFVGLENWRRLFSDPEVKHTAWITVRFAFVLIPIAIV